VSVAQQTASFLPLPLTLYISSLRHCRVVGLRSIDLTSYIMFSSTLLLLLEMFKALNGLCADVALRNYSLIAWRSVASMLSASFQNNCFHNNIVLIFLLFSPRGHY